MSISGVEPVWVTPLRLARLNQKIVSLTGEPHRIRDAALLDSAVNAPRNLFHYEQERDILRLAIRLIRSVGANHPFEQGNKRTAFNGAFAFMAVNKVVYFGQDTIELAQLVEGLILHQASEQDLFAFMAPDCLGR
ncbi:MAG TPA: type II toxin-antitoxin system death-on-curing family toxin [Rhizobiaceae bacterium]|nr:type II toxin-antitoxin system death-on-curing family toxin [Rhizobiaceae bacterium]